MLEIALYINLETQFVYHKTLDSLLSIQKLKVCVLNKRPQGLKSLLSIEIPVVYMDILSEGLIFPQQQAILQNKEKLTMAEEGCIKIKHQQLIQCCTYRYIDICQLDNFCPPPFIIFHPSSSRTLFQSYAHISIIYWYRYSIYLFSFTYRKII